MNLSQKHSSRAFFYRFFLFLAQIPDKISLIRNTSTYKIQTVTSMQRQGSSWEYFRETDFKVSFPFIWNEKDGHESSTVNNIQ